MSRLLVCAPDYFRIDYEINPWMRLSNAVVPERARAQWHGLMRLLEDKIGALLERMEPVPGLPDMVFTAEPFPASRAAARGVVLRGLVSGPRL